MRHAVVARQRSAGFLAEAGHHVERAGRQPAIVRDARERQRRQAGLLCRLEHAGVAHRQRGADRAADDLHRVVPRHDVPGDAVRLAQRQRGVAGRERDRLAHHLVGGPAVELEVARQRVGIGQALLDRLADVERLHARQHVGQLAHPLAHAQQDATALGRAHLSPRAVERGLRRVHGGVDLGRTPARDLRQLGTVGRVQERQRAAERCTLPKPADEDGAGVEVDRFHGRSTPMRAGQSTATAPHAKSANGFRA